MFLIFYVMVKRFALHNKTVTEVNRFIIISDTANKRLMAIQNSFLFIFIGW